MEQSAVEFTVEQLEKLIPSGNQLSIRAILEQANEMFKKQIIDSCNQTEFEDIDGMGIHDTITKGEQYYEEKFKK